MAAEQMHHELAAVAQAEHWDAQLENSRVDRRRAVRIDAVRAAGENDALRIFRADRLKTDAVGDDLAVDAALAHPTGDKLIILAAEIDDQNFFICLLYTSPSPRDCS